MAVFDIIHEISEKQAVKSPLGAQRMFGVSVGIVLENYSESIPGRLKVRIPVRDKNDQEQHELKWARLALLYGGGDRGVYFMPEKDDQVLIIFEDGNIEKPYIIGAVPREKDKVWKQAVTAENSVKEIRTRNGSRLCFSDDTDEGKSDRIILETGGETRHTLTLDNGKKQITLSDKEGNCTVTMASEQGKITVHAAKKLELTVGDQISIKMNGESGAVTVEAAKVHVKSQKSIRLEADGSLGISGKQAKIEGVSSLKCESGGMFVAQGKPVKIG